MKRRLLVIDTETGGLDPARHAIMSVACLVYHDGAVEDTYFSYVNDPEGEVDAEATAVNGITAPHMSLAASPMEVVNGIENMLQKHDMRGKVTCAGHSVLFDIGFLRRLYTLAGRDFDARYERRHLCTQTLALALEQAGRVNLPGGSASLDSVAEALALKARGARQHHAAGDAALTAKCLTKAIRMMTLAGSSTG